MTAEQLERCVEACLRRIGDEFREGLALGGAISIARRGEVLWEQAFGQVDTASGRAATLTTPFSVASVTKPFTATALLSLAEEGRIDLDEPLLRQIDLGIRTHHYDNEGFTLRSLGAHASGLPSYFGMRSGRAARNRPCDLLSAYGFLAFRPLSHYEYSNLGYQIMADVAERYTERSFETLLRTQVIDQLGLPHTFYGESHARRREAALRYDEFGQRIAHYETDTPASGEIFSSIRDLISFASALMNSLGEGSKPLLSARFARQAFDPVLVGANGAYTTFGWSGFKSGGRSIIAKTGGQPGASALVAMLPDQHVAIAAVSNKSGHQTFLADLTAKLASAFLPDWSGEVRDPVDDIAVDEPPFWLRGDWHGELRRDGLRSEARIFARESEVRLVVDGARESTVADGRMADQSASFTLDLARETSGQDTAKLLLKVVPERDALVGRCLVLRESPGFASLMPHPIRFSRV